MNTLPLWWKPTVHCLIDGLIWISGSFLDFMFLDPFLLLQLKIFHALCYQTQWIPFTSVWKKLSWDFQIFKKHTNIRCHKYPISFHMNKVVVWVFFNTQQQSWFSYWQSPGYLQEILYFSLLYSVYNFLTQWKKASHVLTWLLNCRVCRYSNKV